MNPSKSGSNKPSKSALANLLSEKGPKTSALVHPVLQQVGKLAAGVASVNTGAVNSNSATGNPRNKCALQPGHSLMDWIRLGSSGKDLTGVGPRAGQLAVTKQELAQHNKKDDAWLAVRGKVYNVTEYLPFHPGGQEELMKGAGIDATRLFEQVHPWVNYDQILQKCFIGRLVSINPSVDTEALLFGEKNATPKKNTAEVTIKSPPTPPVKASPKPARKETKDVVIKEICVNFLGKNIKLPKVESSSDIEEETDASIEESPSFPRFDWIQRSDYITIIFYTKAFCNPLVEVLPPTVDKTIVISFTYDESVYRNEMNFYESVNWPCTIKVSCETGKVELQFRKTESKIWDNYGVLRQQIKSVSGLLNGAKFNFIFRSKMQVNHNIFLIKLDRTDGGRVVIPIGKHIRAFGNVDGQEMSRSYTPVPQSLFTQLSVRGPTTDELCLMIKRYDNGNVSRFLTDREESDVIHMTKPAGDFELQQIERRELFVLLAAGTGITPMFALIIFLLGRRIRKCQFARLLFFNRTEQDIPFREQLDKLESLDYRLKVNHILSEPGENWTGFTGHVNKEMIENAIQEHIRDTGYTIKDIFNFICGPNQFVSLAIEELHKIGITDEQIYAFEG